MIWTREKFNAPAGNQTPFLGHPASCLIVHGAILLPFIVQYGLNIFDIKFRNLNAYLTFGSAELSGHNKM